MSMPLDKRVARARRLAQPKPLSEYEIHVRVVAMLRAQKTPPLFFHCPNEIKASAQYRAKLARLGVTPGVPDLLILDPAGGVIGGGCVGAALELKSDTGTLKPAQRDFLDRMAGNGWATAVTYGLEQAIAQLRAWGYIA